MTKDEMIRAFDNHIAAEQGGDYDAMVDTMTVDCHRQQPGFGFDLRGGRTAHRHYYRAWFGAFQTTPDSTTDSSHRAFGEDALVLWMNVQLTMQHDFLGIAATGRTARLPMVTIFRFKNGLVRAEITHYDTATMCTELGLSRAEMASALQALAARYAD
jgi:SnoaL-like polyketide cyclase